jgi:hypothetical protein
MSDRCVKCGSPEKTALCCGEPPKIPRTFMSPGYVREVEPGTYALYRDILVEENGVKEKMGKPVGPLALLRPARPDEKEDFFTMTPDGQPLKLVRFYPPKEELVPPDFQPK